MLQDRLEPNGQSPDPIESDLRRALSMMDDTWPMQNDRQDGLTRFVYRVHDLDELLSECERTGADLNYALHRWYNFVTSTAAEAAFCEAGAIPERNKRNHDIDIWLDGIPYDVKLTVYPKRLSTRPYDISTRAGKDQMMRWLYSHQSWQGRKELTNRLYVMVDETNPRRAYAKKADVDAMRRGARLFVDWTRGHGHHTLEIRDGGKVYRPYADLVRIAA